MSCYGGGGSHVLDSANHIAACSKILRPDVTAVTFA
jgi:hypothetical protein